MFDPARITGALAGYPLRSIDPQGLRPAAVLLPLYVREGEDTVLFTRRTEHLNHHRGEISFPGGRRQPDDVDLQATALRETEEEMGIRPADVTVLGRLDDFVSVHGYHVVPFVGTFPWPYSFRVDAREIAEVIEVPLATLRDPAIWRQEDWRHQGRMHPVHFYTVGEHEIWGLTAAILRQFLRRVFGGEG
ncbi:MAG TPA: CoA pyrophosphatase [Desulfuromonadales bacterium]